VGRMKEGQKGIYYMVGGALGGGLGGWGVGGGVEDACAGIVASIRDLRPGPACPASAAATCCHRPALMPLTRTNLLLLPPPIRPQAADSVEVAAAAPFVEKLVADGYEVLYLTEAIDEAVVTNLGKFNDLELVDVSKEGLDLPGGEEDAKKVRRLGRRGPVGPVGVAGWARRLGSGRAWANARLAALPGRRCPRPTPS
jgi:hypothetical protein